jgi:transcriptional regulator with XRE-family HTH domain
MKEKIINQVLCDRMIQLQKEKGVSLETIEEAINTSKGSMSKYMNGIHLPNSDVVKKLAKFWGVSADYLLGLSNDRSTYSAKPDTIPSSYLEVIRNAMAKGVSAEELKDMVETIVKIKGRK